MSLSDIRKRLEAVGDASQFQDLMITGVQTDSRMVSPGDLFVCLTGERFDGHQFVWEAVHKGAAAVLVERPLLDFNGEVPLLLVRNTLQSIGTLAAEWRRRFQGRVIGVTGTAGKTTVKEFLSSMLSTRDLVGKNHKNWNNQLGLPLSILGFSGKEAYWVLEAGVSEKGEMEILGSILNPDLALVVNIGPCHLQGLGDLGGVAAEKCRLLQYVQPGGIGILGRDYPEIFSHLPERDDLQLLSFSTAETGSLYSGTCVRTCSSQSIFLLNLKAGELEVTIPYPGRFMLENVLAAVSTAELLGLNFSNIQKGLAAAHLPEHRCQIQALGKFQIIDDCYNANPLAMKCALSNAMEIKTSGPLVLVLGEMKELGVYAPEAHRELGALAAQTGCVRLIYYGSYAGEIISGLEREGYDGTFEAVHNNREFLAAWRGMDIDEGTVLFKGSRGCGLDKFVEILVQEIA